MLGTYASAALICAASLLVGRALLSLAGRSEWSWLEPAVGFGAIITVTGLLARVVGHGTTRDPGRARAGPRRSRRRASRGCRYARARRAPRRPAGRDRDRPRLRDPLPGQRALGHDRGRLQQRPRPPPRLGRVAAQRLRPDARSPAIRWARTGWRSRSRRCRGSTSGQAFLGEIFAIGVLTGLTALGGAAATSAPARRTLAAALVAITYLAASYFAQGAFKETAEALFVLAFALALRDPAARRRAAAGRGCASSSPTWRWPAASSSPTASPASPGRSRSSPSGA